MLGTVSAPLRSADSLVDARVLLASCGDDEQTLARIVRALGTTLPAQLASLRSALAAEDAMQVGEAAHKLAGMLACFSSVLGEMAGELETRAFDGDLSDAAQQLSRDLCTLAPSLAAHMPTLTIGSLRDRAR